MSWGVGMGRLRQMMDPNSPMIHAGNWVLQSKAGWRWVANLSATDTSGVTMIEEAHERHGLINVTIGQPFSEGEMKPVAVPTLCGLYVRDTDDLIRELQADLSNEKMVAKWMTA